MKGYMSYQIIIEVISTINITYFAVKYDLKLEIISQRFGYCPKYQPETPLSARELKALGLIKGLRLILSVIFKLSG